MILLSCVSSVVAVFILTSISYNGATDSPIPVKVEVFTSRSELQAHLKLTKFVRPKKSRGKVPFGGEINMSNVPVFSGEGKYK